MSRTIASIARDPARATAILAIGLVALALGLFVSSRDSAAVHDLGLFELDANAVAGVAAGDDWSLLDDGFGDPNADDSARVSTFKTDVVNSSGDDIFTGGSSKDDSDVNEWLHTLGSPQDKNDLSNAYAAIYQAPDSAFDPDTDPDTIIYFGLDRYANNGSATVGFWFFQDDISKNPIGVSGTGTFSGVHQVGDILIQSDFTQGGTISRIQAYQWVTSGGDTGDGNLDLIFTGADCDVTAGPDKLCGNANTTCETAPWSFTAKFAKNADNSPCAAGTFPSGSFFEGGVNLSALFPTGFGCVSSFLAETRSSGSSVVSTLSDLVLDNFDLCHLTVTKTPSDTDVCENRDTQITYTYEVQNTGAVTLTVDVVDDNGTPSDDTDDVTVATGVDIAAGGTQTFTDTRPINSTTTNTVTATGTFGADSVEATDDATVNGHTCEITVDKTVSPSSQPEPGGDFTFTVVVTNNSDFHDVTITSLEDDKYGTLAGDADCEVGTVLAANGGSCTFDFVGAFNGNAGDTQTDTVTADAVTDDGATLTDDDDATVTLTDVASSILVTKDASPLSLPEPGGNFTFTVVVTNTSAVDNLTITSLVDSVYGPLTGDADCQVGTVLAPSGSCSFSFTGGFTGNAGASQTDIVTVCAADNDGGTPCDDDDATVTITAPPEQSQLAPTATTCEQFRDGTAGNQEFIVYNITKQGKSGSVSPGVFFYFTTVTVTAGQTVTIDQTDGPSALPAFAVRDATVYNSPSCTQFSKPNCAAGDPVGDCSFTIATAGTYIIRVRYDSQSIGGATVCPNPPTDTYTFETKFGSSVLTSDTLTVAPKPTAKCP